MVRVHLVRSGHRFDRVLARRIGEPVYEKHDPFADARESATARELLRQGAREESIDDRLRDPALRVALRRAVALQAEEMDALNKDAPIFTGVPLIDGRLGGETLTR
ncbi:MAG: hypothetical protein ACYS22_21745 [Planctomycetota bacterium]